MSKGFLQNSLLQIMQLKKLPFLNPAALLAMLSGLLFIPLRLVLIFPVLASLILLSINIVFHQDNRRVQV